MHLHCRFKVAHSDFHLRGWVQLSMDTQFYDVLTAQPVFDKGQIRNRDFQMAMSVGNNRKYKVLDIMGRHFVESGKKAGLGSVIIDRAITEITGHAAAAACRALAHMPGDFSGRDSRKRYKGNKEPSSETAIRSDRLVMQEPRELPRHE